MPVCTALLDLSMRAAFALDNGSTNVWATRLFCMLGLALASLQDSVSFSHENNKSDLLPPPSAQRAHSAPELRDFHVGSNASLPCALQLKPLPSNMLRQSAAGLQDAGTGLEPYVASNHGSAPARAGAQARPETPASESSQSGTAVDSITLARDSWSQPSRHRLSPPQTPRSWDSLQPPSPRPRSAPLPVGPFPAPPSSLRSASQPPPPTDSWTSAQTGAGSTFSGRLSRLQDRLDHRMGLEPHSFEVSWEVPVAQGHKQPLFAYVPGIGWRRGDVRPRVLDANHPGNSGHGGVANREGSVHGGVPRGRPQRSVEDLWRIPAVLGDLPIAESRRLAAQQHIESSPRTAPPRRPETGRVPSERRRAHRLESTRDRQSQGRLESQGGDITHGPWRMRQQGPSHVGTQPPLGGLEPLHAPAMRNRPLQGPISSGRSMHSHGRAGDGSVPSYRRLGGSRQGLDDEHSGRRSRSDWRSLFGCCMWNIRP